MKHSNNTILTHLSAYLTFTHSLIYNKPKMGVVLRVCTWTQNWLSPGVSFAFCNTCLMWNLSSKNVCTFIPPILTVSYFYLISSASFTFQPFIRHNSPQDHPPQPTHPHMIHTHTHTRAQERERGTRASIVLQRVCGSHSELPLNHRSSAAVTYHRIYNVFIFHSVSVTFHLSFWGKDIRLLCS